MSEMGLALMGTGVAKGENRAVQAAQQAISSPLLEDISIHGARAALINISAGPDLGMNEFEEASSIIFKEVDEEVRRRSAWLHRVGVQMGARVHMVWTTKID